LAYERLERRLTAVLAADVAGYSRLTGIDEEGTHVRLKEHLRALVDPKIIEHRGRTVKNTGDGMIAEFNSVVDALRCALDIQRGMARRNTDTPQSERIQFRIGINVGDVIIDDNDIFGDGVNIAVRLESLAEPGGICVSARVQEYAKRQFDLTFEYAGEQHLKYVAQPVHVYRLLLDQSPGMTRRGSASLAPTHLSMVVLPFANLSSEPGQDYFVDGIVETLTTDLSRIPHSLVIARNSAFTYKGKVVDARQIGRELGVRYLIQGSIQCAGARLRVSTQLINAVTGSHVWAERFDRDRGDIFEIQDEIVTHLARALDVELVASESKRAALSPHLGSLDLTFHGWAAMNRGLNPENLKAARRYFEQALALDENNVMAMAGLADAHSTSIVAYMTDDRAECTTAEKMAMKALAVAPNEAKAHASLALVYMSTGRVAQAIAEYERALNLDRNLAFSHANIGIAKYIAGRSQETEEHIARAMRLSPKDAWSNAWCVAAGVAKLSLRQDEQATTWLRRAIDANRSLPLAHFFLASALALQGQTNEALETAKAGLALDPRFTIRRYRDNPLSNNPTYLKQRERVHRGMLIAGVPEG
jgi:TolB-like protein/class 3 adenylate cyclase/TPR repeat protein